MSKTEQEVHKSGAFKQANKSHKTGRHRSKGMVDSFCKGRIELNSGIRKKRKLASKEARRNDIKLRRKTKRDEILARKRQLGTEETPPFLVTAISLCEFTNAHEIVGGLLDCDPAANTTTNSESDLVFLSLPRFKQRYCFCFPDSTKLYKILDTLKVSDTVIFLWPQDGVLSEASDLLLSCVFAQGLPSSIHAILNLGNEKKKEVLKRNVIKSVEQWFSDNKVFVLSSDSDYLNLCRQIGEGKKKQLVMQERRPHLIAENVTVNKVEVCDVADVLVTGYVRGPCLDVNQLVHICGFGDYQMKLIELVPDPNGGNKKRSGNGMDCEDGVKILAEADPKLQTSLESEVFPDPMQGEQTWPTQEELDLAEEKTVRKVPKGTSDYQATWIVDSDEEDNDSVSEQEAESEASEMEVTDSEEEGEEGEDGVVRFAEETESITSPMDTDKYDRDMDEELEKEELERFRKERENVMFPDEIDTPADVPAKIRFQKYRGLKSYRSSPWDPKENLPYDYSRIFQFQNFNRARNRVLKEERTGVMHGWYVRITVCNVPNEIAENMSCNGPLILFGMLPHEHKMSLVNLAIRKHRTCNLTVRNKDKLVFHVGYRRFVAQPTFSQHSTGDKHKLERYLPDGGCVVASLYAPIAFPPAPVLVFKVNSKGEHRLVATGSLLDVRPSRVVVKRIVLSGHPMKINRHSCVVRYMFFTRDDIMWFKPVELRTKMGRRGHIREPLGTHGHMKCTFDAQLNSQDTVLMNLYKRVYPKWSYDPKVPQPTPFRELSTAVSVEEDMNE